MKPVDVQPRTTSVVAIDIVQYYTNQSILVRMMATGSYGHMQPHETSTVVGNSEDG